mmetsp:Transcript_34246/g.68191  ORF Transcript_34246/g.68191 Transcript_34246/m.68191 type:complete len:205 (-) Transcript_34246:186-800(-)
MFRTPSSTLRLFISAQNSAMSSLPSALTSAALRISSTSASLKEASLLCEITRVRMSRSSLAESLPLPSVSKTAKALISASSASPSDISSTSIAALTFWSSRESMPEGFLSDSPGDARSSSTMKHRTTTSNKYCGAAPSFWNETTAPSVAASMLFTVSDGMRSPLSSFCASIASRTPASRRGSVLAHHLKSVADWLPSTQSGTGK